MGEFPPPLTPDEFTILFAAYKSGDMEAGKTIVLHNMRFVAQMAYGYANKTTFLKPEDFISEGAIALMQALRRFDPARGSNYLSYAKFWLMQRMGRLIDCFEHEIRLPVSKCRGKTKDLALRPHVNSLHEPLPWGDDGFTVEDQVAAPEEERTEFDGDYSDALALALQGMPPHEREVIRMRFGMDDGGPKTLQQIADLAGVSKERIRQIEDNAMLRLRQLFSSQLEATHE